MFNILDMVWYKCNFRQFARSTLKKMITEKPITSEKEFYDRYGDILIYKCSFEQAYNEIISDAYKTQYDKYGKRYNREIENIFDEIFVKEYASEMVNFHFFLTEGILWCMGGYGSLSDKWGLGALLIAYVLSQHCDLPEYRNIKKLGLLGASPRKIGDKRIGTIRFFNISDISDKTFSNVCKEIIGYNTPKEQALWRDSYGTNVEKQIALYQYHEVEIPKHLKLDVPKRVEIEGVNNALILSNNVGNELSILSNFSKRKEKNRDIYYISDIHFDYDMAILNDKMNNLFEGLKNDFLKNTENEDDYQYINRIENSYFFIMGDTSSDLEHLKTFYCILRDILKQVCGSSEKLYIVLGNHEFVSFDTVENGKYYFNNLAIKENINILLNTFKETNEFIILGGTGFAKYNDEFNANNIICAKNFTREEEIEESNNFYNVYLEALKVSEESKKPLIVLTHYPVKDWLENENTSKNVYYFSGHTHRNNFVNEESKVIIADNQIGYKNKNAKFRKYTIGVLSNPFDYYEDGCYEIKSGQYDKFMRYAGKYYRSSYHIETSLLSESAKFYMLKVYGYYGFFLIDTKKDAKICCGGIVKTINNTKGKDISYFYNRFAAMVKMQLSAFSGYYSVLQNISKEVKKMGLDGKVHGCIVDLDFYNHIMLNPMDGSLTYYYSPEFGYVKTYETFEKLLINSLKDTLELTEYTKILKKYQKIKKENNSLIVQRNIFSNSENSDLEKIQIKGSMYSVSREMNKYQILFESNILTVWDELFLKDTPFELEEAIEIE